MKHTGNFAISQTEMKLEETRVDATWEWMKGNTDILMKEDEDKD